jgi:hypothetical protein
MASTYSSIYRSGVNSGTSGAEVSDLRPEQAYDTDFRRLDPEERESVETINRNQDRVARYMRAAKTAGAYQQRTSIDEPLIRGKIPRMTAVIEGTELPSTGDSGGRTGAVGYARKPKPNFGKSFI